MIMLKIGALDIATLAALDIEQSYEPLGGETILRAIDGTGIKQATWRKTRILTSGGGWLPPGLEAIDTNAPLTLACITPRSVPANFATRQATLPTTRRSDAGHAPWGLAILADGQAVRTPLTLSGNTATLDVVTGAVAYQALYLPQFTVWAARPTESGSRAEASYQWQLVCEEV